MTAFPKGILALFSIVLLVWALRSQEDSLPKPREKFEADELVSSLTVKIHVDEGSDCDEPLALDLGLGFPLWLQPVGRKSDELTPYGAIPQKSDAQGTLKAGSTGTFTFELAGDAGQDLFQSTSQLLKDVKVSDISRIGFMSQATHGWILKSYEITVNEKLFASGSASKDPPNQTPAQTLVKPKMEQELARLKMADLGTKIAAIDANRSELIELVNTNLANEDDTKNLASINQTYQPLLQERRRLEGQLSGVYCWYEDKTFASPWRDAAPIQSVRVTLLTDTHSAADTQNYVYFRTGGHSYLLGSPAAPLSGADGPQVFSLDLISGPLKQSDIRGYSLGMIGQPKPFGKTPDRWHPLRLIVEIDGKSVYDSETVDLDRKSLQAIRMIPPVHADTDGTPITNSPISRETFVWKAGNGAGLDPKTLQPLPLPDASDPAFPKAESDNTAMNSGQPKTDDSKPHDPKPADSKPEDSKPDDTKADPTQPEDSKPDDPKDPKADDTKDANSNNSNSSTTPDPQTDNSNNFPGEKGSSSGSGSSFDGSGGGTGGSSGGGSMGGGDSNSPSSGGGGSTDSPPGSNALPPAASSSSPPSGSTAVPFGKPIQINQVRIVSGYKMDDTFSIIWTISGDESTVDHYEISLLPIRPEKAVPSAEAVYTTVSQPRGARSATLTIPSGTANGDYFIAPVVTAMPLVTSPAAAATPSSDPNAPSATPIVSPNPTSTPHLKIGAAKMLFPAGTVWDPATQPVLGGGPAYGGVRSTFAYRTPYAFSHSTQLLSGGMPAKRTDRGVWSAGSIVSDSGILFEATGRGCHVGIQPQAGDSTQVFLKVNCWSGSSRRLVAHLGFLGGPGASGSATALLERNWLNSAGAPITGYQTLGSPVTAVAGDPMPSPLTGLISPLNAPSGAVYMGIRVTITGGPFDAVHPPALFGVRLVSQ